MPVAESQGCHFLPENLYWRPPTHTYHLTFCSAFHLPLKEQSPLCELGSLYAAHGMSLLEDLVWGSPFSTSLSWVCTAQSKQQSHITSLKSVAQKWMKRASPRGTFREVSRATGRVPGSSFSFAGLLSPHWQGLQVSISAPSSCVPLPNMSAQCVWLSSHGQKFLFET